MIEKNLFNYINEGTSFKDLTEEEKKDLREASKKQNRDLNLQEKSYLKENKLDEKEWELKNYIRDYLDKTDLSKKLIDKMPYFYDKAKNWWLWNFDKCSWELVDDTQILIFVKKLCPVSTTKPNERNEILEAMKQEGRQKIPKEIKKTWLQFQKYIFDLNTGEIFMATPEYFVTNPIPYKLHQENFEETPVMDRIFKEWVGEDYVKTLYEVIAYCMLPDYPVHRLFCFIGSGLNGKSKFLELLKKFIGEENVCSTELDTLLSSRFEVTKLHKKLVCQMGETNFNEISRTSILKKLTGGDLIGFEYKNKTPFESKNYAKIIIATNSIPTTTDKTIGFYRRWLIIDFPFRFNEEKDILKDIPEEEYESLALKCTSILNDLLKKRRFHKEGSVEERIKRYEEKSDYLKKFLDEFVETSGEGYITKADFHKKFTSWCNETHHRALAENTLGKKMKEKEVESIKKHFNWLNDGRGGSIYVWEGVKWKNE